MKTLRSTWSRAVWGARRQLSRKTRESCNNLPSWPVSSYHLNAMGSCLRNVDVTWCAPGTRPQVCTAPCNSFQSFSFIARFCCKRKVSTLIVKLSLFKGSVKWGSSSTVWKCLSGAITFNEGPFVWSVNCLTFYWLAKLKLRFTSVNNQSSW